MRPMTKTPAGFRAVLSIGWIALGAAGVMYARVKGIPTWAAMPMLAAFLVEYPFYLVPAFPGLRDRFAGNRLPPFLLAAALLPYLAACCGAIPFHWIAAGKLTALALGMGFWYRVLPARPIVDIAFVAIVPCVLLGKYLVPVYSAHLPKFKDLIFLGHVTLIVIAVMVLLVERRVDDVRYGFIPNCPRMEDRIPPLPLFHSGGRRPGSSAGGGSIRRRGAGVEDRRNVPRVLVDHRPFGRVLLLGVCCSRLSKSCPAVRRRARW